MIWWSFTLYTTHYHKLSEDSKKTDEIRQILYLLYEHNKITKKVYNSLIKSL